MSDGMPGTGRWGRVAKAPAGNDPAAVLARQLWELKQCAGNRSYDVMCCAHGALASKSALSEAARGVRLPSWNTTWEFVRALAVGVLDQEEHQVCALWRPRWEQAAAAVRTQQESQEEARNPTPVDSPPESVACPPAAAGIRWHKRALAAVVAIGVLVFALLWPAAPAPVVQTCQARWPCLYGSVDFADMKFQTQRQNICWPLANYDLQDTVLSYDNNLPVAGHFHDAAKNRIDDVQAGDRSGDSSRLRGAFWFCTGVATP